MKPLFLSIQAFGAFLTKQELDFQQFSSLFLIHGPTGAGKTTIFDAMCYALYGETTGGRKNMRSDYADEKTETVVEFVFLVGLQAYRIIRKLKITGKTEKTISEKQTYEEGVWKDNIFTPEKEPIVKKTDIKDKIEQILGFTEAQFKQIIVLPQGNFQEFLRSKNNEKTEVLQKLFNAQIYQQIREKLEERGKEYQRKHEELDTKIHTILQANQLQHITDLDTQIADYEQHINQLKQNIPALEKERDTAQQNLKNAQELNKIFVELTDAEAKLAQHTQAQHTITEIQEKLTRNENAEPFKADMAALKELEKQRSSYESNILNQQAIVMRTERKIIEINNILKDKQEIWEETIEKNKLKINDLEKIKPKFETIESKERDLQAELKKMAGVQKDLKNFQDTSTKYTAQEKDLKNKLQDLDNVKQRKGEFEQILAQLKEKQLAYQNLQTARNTYKTLEQAVKDASEKVLEAGKQAQQKREQYNLIDAQWRNSQAFALAEKLVEGEPCLVCGATHHPQKATQTTAVITEAVLKKAQTDFDNAEKKYRDAELLKKDRQKEADEQLVVGKSLREQLGELASLTAEEFNAKVKDAQANFAQAQQATQEAEKIAKQLANISTEANATLMQIKTHEGKENELKTIIAIQENLIRQLIDDIPKEVNNLAQLHEAIQKYADEKEKAQDLLHKHQEELKTEIDKMNKAKHTIEEDEKQLKGNRLQKKEGILDSISSLEKNIEKNLAKYGFMNIKTVMDALLKEEEKNTYKQKTEKYTDEKGKLQAILDDRKKKINQQTRPDLPALQQTAQQLETQYMESNRQLTQFVTEKDKMIAQKNEIDKQNIELKELVEAHEGLAELVNVANGKNDLRQKFEIFVLSVFLDEVLYYANQRLDLLSNGRYQLERTDAILDGRKGAGMDLLVSDQYTGTTRPVENLSGGETFFTSLSLALAWQIRL